jgi:predicted CXXCH cytochrome family protein
MADETPFRSSEEATMKTTTLKTLASAAALALAFAAPASAQVTNSKHNLSSGGPGPNKVAETAEVCVFCHTPHGSDTSAAVPLWNKTLPASNTFTTYDQLNTSTLDAEILTVGSVSIACLSCHDGAQAMDLMLNEPGSGTNTVATWTWTGTGQLTTGIVSIGKDLKNDHPIGVSYAGNVPGGQAAVDADFYAATQVTGKSLWYVDVNADGTRQSSDLILYTRRNKANSADWAYVECATCHDPHKTTNGTFLRTSNAASALCKACHNK